MTINIRQRIKSTLLGVIALSTLASPAVFADEYYDAGLKFFKQKDYARAKQYFDKAAENAPWDSNAFYYGALSAQYQRDFKTAKELWGKIIDRFPGTPACVNATAVMKQLDPGYFTRARLTPKPQTPSSPVGTPSPVSAGAGDPNGVEALLAKVQYTSPPQARIPISRVDNRVVLDAQINNRSIKIEFNGSSTSVTPKEAAALGLTNPDRTPLKVGQRAVVPVRLGDISTQNFPVVVEDGDRGRLGDDFFRQFSYTVEPSQLVVTKKSGSTARGQYDVPFKKQGQDMIVDVTINGRRVSMVFDKDGGECIVPKKRAREFGLQVEESESMSMFDPEKQSGPLRGEPGFGEVKVKKTAEAKISLGPVNNVTTTVKVDDTAKDAKLGASVLSGWKFTVDPTAGLIRFSR